MSVLALPGLQDLVRQKQRPKQKKMYEIKMRAMCVYDRGMSLFGRNILVFPTDGSFRS